MAEDLGGFVVILISTKLLLQMASRCLLPNITIAYLPNADQQPDRIKALVETPKMTSSRTVTARIFPRIYRPQARLRNLEKTADQLQKIMEEAYKPKMF